MSDAEEVALPPDFEEEEEEEERGALTMMLDEEEEIGGRGGSVGQHYQRQRTTSGILGSVAEEPVLRRDENEAPAVPQPVHASPRHREKRFRLEKHGESAPSAYMSSYVSLSFHRIRHASLFYYCLV